MHHLAKDFLKTFLMSAPVTGRSLCLQVLQSACYTSRLPVAMSLAGLKMYGDDYGNSSDDGRPDEVPNSGPDSNVPHKAGPVLEEDRGPKKLCILSLCSPVDGNESNSSSCVEPVVITLHHLYSP